MDAADFAQKSNEVYLDAALKRQKAKSHIPSPLSSPSGGEERGCLDCREKINPARLAANPQTSRCIECQTEFERAEKNGSS
jgi:phage/conjugal plasmid C-4 type zinc finger TraR family protein